MVCRKCRESTRYANKHLKNDDMAMKVLFLSQGRKVEDHPGWDWSLKKLKEEGFIEDYLNVPWQGYGETHGWNSFYRHVVDTAKAGKFDVVYFHYFHRRDVPSPANCIKALKELSNKPTVIVSGGDPFSDNWMPPRYPANFRIAAGLADIVFSTQMGRAAEQMQKKWGAKNVVYTPNSLCPVRFSNHAIDPTTHKFDFDIVMVGSRNGLLGRNVITRHTFRAFERTRMVKALCNHFGKRFGLFGHGWDGLISNQGPAPFDEQQKYFQRGRVLVGGNPYSFSDYYSSNRVFFEIASGVPTVELKVNRLDKVLRDGDQVYFADNVDGVIAKCEELLQQDPVELYAKAARAAKEIVERHTQYHRMKFKLDTVRRYRENGNRLDVVFPFFLPEVDLQEEMKYAARTK